MMVSMVSLCQELEDARAVIVAAQSSEEAGPQQLTRMMDEQLAQSQTIEALRRQVETSSNSARKAQALLRDNQDQQSQQSRMLPPTTYPSGTGGIISNTPFMPPFSTPSMGMCTRGPSIDFSWAQLSQKATGYIKLTYMLHMAYPYV